MRKIEESVWNNLSDLTPEKKLCVEAWLDMTTFTTLDSYRFRAMNLKTLVEEFIEAVDLYRAGVSPTNDHVAMIADELLYVCAKERAYVDPHDEFLGRLDRAVNIVKGISSARRSEKEERALNSHMLTIRLCFSRLNTEYRSSLTNALIDSASAPGNWRDRLRTLSSLLSDYFAEGVSIEHLHRQGKKLLEPDGEATTASFESRLRTSLEGLNRVEGWDVYFSVSFPPTNPRTAADGVLNFDPHVPVEVKNALGGGDDITYAKVFVIAPDKESAAVKARQILDASLDVAWLADRRKNSDVFLECYVMNLEHPTEAGIASSVEIMNLLPSFGSWVPKLSSQVAQIQEADWLATPVKARIANSLRNYRMSKLAAHPHSRFLHVWVALESLVTGNSTRTHMVLPAVARLMGMVYLETLLINFIVESYPFEAPTLKSKIDAAAPTDNVAELLYRLLLNETAVAELRRELAMSPLLQCRLDELVEAVSTPRSTLRFIKKHVQRVEWQLFRLNRARNAIMHEAVNVPVSRYMAHLDYYMYTLVGALAEQLTKHRKYKTIDDFLDRTSTLYEEFTEKLTSAQNPLPPSITLSPWSLEV